MTSPQNKIVRLKYTGDSYGYESGTTGKIPCLNGFTAEVRLIKPRPGYNNWRGIDIFLAADQISVDQCYS